MLRLRSRDQTSISPPLSLPSSSLSSQIASTNYHERPSSSLLLFPPFSSPPSFSFLSLLDNPRGCLVRWSVDLSRPFSPFYGVTSPHSSTSKHPSSVRLPRRLYIYVSSHLPFSSLLHANQFCRLSSRCWIPCFSFLLYPGHHRVGGVRVVRVVCGLCASYSLCYPLETFSISHNIPSCLDTRRELALIDD